MLIWFQFPSVEIREGEDLEPGMFGMFGIGWDKYGGKLNDMSCNCLGIYDLALFACMHEMSREQ
jgi:hypothetical protein